MHVAIETRARFTPRGVAICVAICALLFARPAIGTVRSVPGQHPSIQAAIDASLTGDVVEVAPGNYFESIDFRGRAITVRATAGPETTTIDPSQGGSAVVFRNGEDSDSVLEGFTLTHGIGTAYGTMRFGGAILCDGSSPTIRHCILEANVADFGGGIACLAISHPRLESLVVRDNQVFGRGGGIHLEDLSFAEIVDCTITQNEANRTGGGISAVAAGGYIARCDIADNFAASGGGGVSLSQGSDAFLDQNRIRGNESRSAGGGGMRCIDSSPVLLNNVFERNRTGHDADGGGLYCTQAEPVVRNNAFLETPAAGLGQDFQ